LTGAEEEALTGALLLPFQSFHAAEVVEALTAGLLLLLVEAQSAQPEVVGSTGLELVVVELQSSQTALVVGSTALVVVVVEDQSAQPSAMADPARAAMTEAVVYFIIAVVNLRFDYGYVGRERGELLCSQTVNESKTLTRPRRKGMNEGNLNPRSQVADVHNLFDEEWREGRLCGRKEWF
jgi:hypothetical protein